MADEAVVRIILQEQGSSSTASVAPPPDTTHLPVTSLPPPQQQTAFPALVSSLTSIPSTLTAPIEPPESEPSGPPVSRGQSSSTISLPNQDEILDEARSALVALGEKRSDADRLIARLISSGEQFVSVQDAIIAAYRNPQQPAIVPLDSAGVQSPPLIAIPPPPTSSKTAEQDIPKAEQPFDPMEEARKRREREQRKAQVDAAYEQQYGIAKEETGMDSILKMVDNLRGTIGGIGGTLVGSILDAVMSVRDAKSKAEGDRGRNDLLADVSPEVLVGRSRQDATSVADLDIKPAPQQVALPDMPANPPTIASNAPTEGKGVPAPPMPSPAPVDAVAAALPPVAIAMAIKAAVDAVNAAVIGGIKAAVGGASGVANFAADAGADPSVPIGKLGNAASSAGEKISEKLSPALGWMVIAVGETISALSTLMQGLDKTAERYGEYSSEIAQAQAIAEIRQTMGDFRRAQEVSGEMAKYLMAQSDLQQKFEDIKVKLLVRIVPVVTRILEVIESAMSTGEGITDAITTLASPLKDLATFAADFVGMKRDERIPKVVDPTAQLFSTRFDDGGDWVPDR